jgi:hypothetical protein
MEIEQLAEGEAYTEPILVYRSQLSRHEQQAAWAQSPLPCANTSKLFLRIRDTKQSSLDLIYRFFSSIGRDSNSNSAQISGLTSWRYRQSSLRRD